MFPKPQAKTKLQIEIDKLVLSLDNHDVKSDEYGLILERLSKMHKLEQDSKPKRVNPDTVILAVTNIIGIATIVKHEQFNVITSKALSFVIKPK